MFEQRVLDVRVPLCGWKGSGRTVNEMNTTEPVTMVVTSADALDRTISALGDVNGVVALFDPRNDPPHVECRQLTVGVVDATMPEHDWVHRFGGEPHELFNEHHLETLETAANWLSERATPLVVHCSQGVSRSTAAAAVIAALNGASPHGAVQASLRAQQLSFRWRTRVAWHPNTRILTFGSHRVWGDDRLVAAAAVLRDTFDDDPQPANA